MEQALPNTVLRSRLHVEPEKSVSYDSDNNSVGTHSSNNSNPRASLSPIGSRRRLSHGTDGSESPLQHELRKLNRIASKVAMAVTESHQSDNDEDTGSDIDEDDTGDIDEWKENDIDLDEPAPIVEKEDGSPSPTLRKIKLDPNVTFSAPQKGIVIQSNTPLDMLDDADKFLSLKVFRLDLGMAFEFIMLIFGTWFGLPVPAWGLWTAFFGFIDEFQTELQQLTDLSSLFRNESNNARDTGFVLVALAFCLYSIAFVRWVYLGKYHSVYANLKQLLAVPVLFTVTFYFGTRNGGRHLGAFFAVAWVVAETIGHIFKYCFRRVRPIAYFGDSLPRRYFPDVQAMFSKGHTAYESFPSADTTGGAVFAGMLMKMELLDARAAIGVSLLIAFSRMYLQVHHLFDVAFALVLGWATILLMWPTYGETRAFGPSHAIFAVCFFVVFSLIARKFKRPLPQHMQRAKSMYGF